MSNKAQNWLARNTSKAVTKQIEAYLVAVSPSINSILLLSYLSSFFVTENFIFCFVVLKTVVTVVLFSTLKTFYALVMDEVSWISESRFGT
jgi:hypothetical protein